ncbi:hypothetical protein glysoja_029611 [Glycine soja]|uniref:Uncharacterized protein n=1 Tax=Glycine soja TaxID=3848 RepID=A0A0B2R3W5_GLYSO|nr:hypothetical protein glysoja_029611 [Glycine soja]
MSSTVPPVLPISNHGNHQCRQRCHQGFGEQPSLPRLHQQPIHLPPPRPRLAPPLVGARGPLYVLKTRVLLQSHPSCPQKLLLLPHQVLRCRFTHPRSLFPH